MIKERLLKLRERAGISQNEISKRLGIARTTYASYEQGAREPDLEMLGKLSEFFDVTVDYLIGKERAVDDQTKNVALEIYGRLPQEKKKLIDDMIKALEERR
jgi:transcriptional regulator with XRE-family HTH domain